MAQGWTTSWYPRFGHVTKKIFPEILDFDHFHGKIATQIALRRGNIDFLRKHKYG
jgi:hypothetical protein